MEDLGRDFESLGRTEGGKEKNREERDVFGDRAVIPRVIQEGTDTQQLEYDLGVRAGMSHPYNPHEHERQRTSSA
jgi:hypothetical protein